MNRAGIFYSESSSGLGGSSTLASGVLCLKDAVCFPCSRRRMFWLVSLILCIWRVCLGQFNLVSVLSCRRQWSHSTGLQVSGEQLVRGFRESRELIYASGMKWEKQPFAHVAQRCLKWNQTKTVHQWTLIPPPECDPGNTSMTVSLLSQCLTTSRASQVTEGFGLKKDHDVILLPSKRMNTEWREDSAVSTGGVWVKWLECVSYTHTHTLPLNASFYACYLVCCCQFEVTTFTVKQIQRTHVLHVVYLSL